MRLRTSLSFLLTLSATFSLPARAQTCGVSPVVQTLPSGNAGAHGPLTLATDSSLLVGDSFDARVTGGPPNAHGCVAWSFGEGSLALTKYAATFHPQLPATFTTFELDANGSMAGLLSVPTIDPSFCGTTIVLQAVTTDPTSPGGVGVSNALLLRIGDVAPASFAYVLDCGRAAVTAYLVDRSGVPAAEHPGSPFPTGGARPISACYKNLHDNNNALVEVGGILYTANEASHDVSALRIEADGSLTPLPGSPYPSGGFNPRSLAVHPSGAWLYVANDTNGTLGILAIAPGGSLSEAHPSVSSGLNGLMNVEMHPSGQVLWTSYRIRSGGYVYNTLRAYAVEADGDLTDQGTFGQAQPYAGMAVTGAGDHFYAVTALGTSNPNLPRGVFGFDVLLSPAIGFPLVAASPFFNTAETTDVTEDVAVSADERFLFVYNLASQYNSASFAHVHTYAIDASGALTSVARTPTTGYSGRILEASAEGTRLYTVGQRVEVYEIETGGGVRHLGTSPKLSVTPSTSLGLVLVR